MEVLSARRGLSVLGATVVGVLGMAGVAGAATFTVNDSTDAALSNVNGTSCVSTDGGSCTLRAAVQAADNAGGASQITVPAGTYKLTIAPASANNPANGDLDIKNGATVTLTGAGSASTLINPAGIDRAFAVQAGTGLSISGVTVMNGAQPNTAPSNHSTGAGEGGAFYNDGSLSVNSSVLTGNSAASEGGAVFSDAAASSTSITNSTVTANVSDDYGGALTVYSGAITLTGDTITHNSSESDGAALDDEENGNTVGTVTIDSTANDPSTISDNVAQSDGGALYLVDAGALTVSNSTLDNNATDGDEGGAIYDSDSGLFTVTGSTFSGDAVGGSYGGALYTDGTDLSVADSTFTGDSATDGGAIETNGSTATAVSTITTSTFANDSASGNGGGVDAAYGNLQISDSTFSGNTASDDGGGLYYDSTDGLGLTNDTFDGNQSVDGGGLFLDDPASTGTIALLNDTIARNSGYEGGGIYEPENANSIRNTIVADNSGGTGASGGGDCYHAATDSAGAADQDGNVDSDGTCFSVAGHTHDQINVDPLLGQLSDNGGPTETDLLQPGSPAIGNAVASACPAADQRGTARSTVQGQCDSGAFQTAPTSLTLANTAPASATVGYPFNDTITASDGGPGPSTGTTIVDQLPANTTLYGVTPSQGTCTSSGTPATVTCALGVVNNGSAATVSMVVAVSDAGAVTNTATATNGQGNSVGASATTQINAAAATTTTTPTTTPATATPTTNPSGPTAISAGTATGSVSRTGANLLGQVMTGGQSTAYFFQYGRSSQYGGATAVQQTTTAGSVAANITGLRYHTRYHYRLVAINTSGVSYGADRTLVTALRVKAKKVGLFTKQAVATRQPHSYTLAGKLTLARGITKAEGCTGSLTITIVSGSRTVASHKVKVSRTCSYKSSFTVTKRLAEPGKLHARARFGGNSTLFGTKSKTITVRYG